MFQHGVCAGDSYMTLSYQSASRQTQHLTSACTSLLHVHVCMLACALLVHVIVCMFACASLLHVYVCMCLACACACLHVRMCLTFACASFLHTYFACASFLHTHFACASLLLGRQCVCVLVSTYVRACCAPGVLVGCCVSLQTLMDTSDVSSDLGEHGEGYLYSAAQEGHVCHKKRTRCVCVRVCVCCTCVKHLTSGVCEIFMSLSTCGLCWPFSTNARALMHQPPFTCSLCKMVWLHWITRVARTGKCFYHTWTGKVYGALI